MKAIGLYYRVSSAPQNTPDKDSIPSQQKAGREFAASKSLPYKEFQDVLSGGSPTRIGFIHLSQAIEDGTIDAVWVRDTERLARDVNIGTGLLNLLKAYKGTLFIGSLEIDPSNYQQVLLPQIGFAVAEYAKGSIRANTLRGRKASIEKGNRTTHNMYGYDSTFNNEGRRVLTVNAQEAKVVKHVYKLYVKGASFNQIARALNDEEVRTKTAGKTIWKRGAGHKGAASGLWSKEMIAHMIRRPEYVGYVWNWDKDKLIPAAYVPKILDMNLTEWKSLYSKVDARAKERNLGINPSDHEISSLVECEYCGAHYLYRHARDTDQKHYRHKPETTEQKNCKTVPKYLKVEIERIFEIGVYVIFSDTDEIDTFVDSYIKEIERRTKDALTDRSTLLEQIEKTEKAITNVLDAIETAGHDESLIQRLNQRKAEKDGLRVKVEEFDKRVELAKSDMREIAESFSEEFLEEFKDAKDGATRRGFYISLIDKAVIRDNVLLLRFKNGKSLSIRVAQRRNSRFLIDVYFRDAFYPEIAMSGDEKSTNDFYQVSLVYDYKDNSIYFDRDRFVEMYQAASNIEKTEAFDNACGLIRDALPKTFHEVRRVRRSGKVQYIVPTGRESKNGVEVKVLQIHPNSTVSKRVKTAQMKKAAKKASRAKK